MLLAASPLYLRGYQRYYSEKYGKLTEIISGSDQFDVVYLGSSRVHSGIDPSVVDQANGTRSYNLGMDGASLYETNLLFEAFLARHPMPNLVVLSVDLVSFDLSPPIYDPIEYLPFLSNPLIRSALVDIDFVPRYGTWLPFLSVSLSDDFTRKGAFEGFLGHSEIRPGSKAVQGFLSIPPSVSYEEGKKAPKLKPTTEGVAILDSIIMRVKSANKRIVLTYLPEYRHQGAAQFPNPETAFELIQSAAGRNGVTYVRYDEQPLCQTQANFADPLHLGDHGAQQFSRLLAEDVRSWRGGSTAPELASDKGEPIKGGDAPALAPAARVQ